MIFNIDKWFNKSSYGVRSQQGDSTWTSVNTSMPPKIEISNDRLSLMSLNVGTAYACSTKISNFLSAVPLHVYAEVPANSVDDLITPHKMLSKKELNTLRTITKNIKIGRKGIHKLQPDTAIVELYEHPLIDLLHRPNGYMSWADWVVVLETYLSILGNAYFLIERKGSEIVALHPLLAEYVWTYSNQQDGTIIRYEYYPTSNGEYKARIFQPDEILHFKTPSAGSIQSGRGWIETVQKEIRLLDECNNHQIALASNMGQPGAIITIHGKVGSKSEAEKVASEFTQKWGKLRRGNPLVSFSQNENDKIEVEPFGHSIKDMAYVENQPFLRQQICAAAGVPEDLIHSGSSNRASSVTAMQTFLSFTIMPRMNGIIEQLNHKIAPMYDENVFIGYMNEEMVSTDPAVQSTMLKTYVDAGIMSVNEARGVLDLEPIEGMDTPQKAQSNSFGDNSNTDNSNTDNKDNKDTTEENK